MSQTLHSNPAHAVRIHCPASVDMIEAMRAGEVQAIETDPTVAPLLAIIRADNPLGDFGLCKGVVEIALGYESFTPTEEVSPTTGKAGAVCLVPSVILTTYIAEYIADGAAWDAVSAALAEIVAAHPWETPVIELCATALLTRQP
jgi:hypothetical protein